MMVKLKPYKNYKPVELNFSKQLPFDWIVKRGKFFFKEISERSKKGEEQLLSVSEHKGIVPRDSINVTMFQALSYEGYKLCNKGDIVINSLWAWHRGLGVSEHHGIVSTAYGVYRPQKPEQWNHKYLNYLLRDKTYVGECQIRSKGIWESRYQLTGSNFLDIPVLQPPLEVQNKIVAYLDKKNAEIDKFIRNKERLIELLEEEKNYKIEKLLFRGIDNTLRFKNKGIEYIPQIPDHWDMFKIKYIAKINPGKPFKRYSKNSMQEVVFLPMEKVSENGTISNEIKRPIKEVWNGYTFFAKNDILLAKITPCFENGKGAFLNKLETEIGFGTTEFHVLRAGKNIEPMFLHQILRTKIFKKLGEENMHGSAGQQRVPTEFLKNYFIGIPPQSEQLKILDQIQEINSQTDLIISKAQKEIALIKEYRESLITNLVTGKRRVPDKGV